MFVYLTAICNTGKNLAFYGLAILMTKKITFRITYCKFFSDRESNLYSAEVLAKQGSKCHHFKEN